jgi:hypothetical protein
MRTAHRTVGGAPEKSRPLGRPRHRLKDIRINVTGTGYKRVGLY